MTRLERGFYDGNGEFVTADERVECRFGGGRGTVNAIFQNGEAEVMFDDDADLSLVKWDQIWKLPSGAQKHEKFPPAIRPNKIVAGPVWWNCQARNSHQRSEGSTLAKSAVL
jgi:hypothetical protein